jgi:hypothetical protein
LQCGETLGKLENRWGIRGCNWDKKLKTFAPCYSQSPPPADFTPNYGFMGFEISTPIAESRWVVGIDFVYIYLFVYL